MTKEKKKYEAGAATNYASRGQAIKKLQLSLKDFRRLCILKGIYPHEPRHKKKVNKGSTHNKQWYYAKDIQFLAHEPIIGKFREQKAFMKRLKKYEMLKDNDRVQSLKRKWPKYKLDHVVRERYPSLVDAVRDLDDALCLLFLFARLPSRDKIVPTTVTRMCHRLTMEFLHYVIAAKAIKKVFVSIKGVYYQANILGETVTWIVQHDRVTQDPVDVDFSVMATFVEFYTTMVGFVNFGLYRKFGLHYPPKLQFDTFNRNDVDLDPEIRQEAIFSLTQPLLRDGDVQPETDIAPIDEFGTDMTDEQLSEAQRIQKAEHKIPTLFANCRFFLNREVPKESLTFIIKSCGGTVSWQDGYGKTYGTDDEHITHVIVDRPNVAQKHIGRAYVQPQWVYDSVNARCLLATHDYLPDMVLPPHLSPFVLEQAGDYVPPERLQQLQLAGHDVSELTPKDDRPDPDVQSAPKSKRAKKSQSVGRKDNNDVNESTVSAGEVYRVHPQKAINAVGEKRKLQEMMLAKKHKRVYHKIMKGRKKKAKEVRGMKAKRATVAS